MWVQLLPRKHARQTGRQRDTHEGRKQAGKSAREEEGGVEGEEWGRREAWRRECKLHDALLSLSTCASLASLPLSLSLSWGALHLVLAAEALDSQANRRSELSRETEGEREGNTAAHRETAVPVSRMDCSENIFHPHPPSFLPPFFPDDKRSVSEKRET